MSRFDNLEALKEALLKGKQPEAVKQEPEKIEVEAEKASGEPEKKKTKKQIVEKGE